MKDGPIQVSVEKVTTVAQWRAAYSRGSWRSNVRRRVGETGKPQFVLRADGSGTLYYTDAGKVRQMSWKRVTVINRAA